MKRYHYSNKGGNEDGGMGKYRETEKHHYVLELHL